MTPEAWGATAVAVLVSAVLGALGKSAYSILVAKWKKDEAATAQDHRITAAERRERRTDQEGVIEHLYKRIASQDEDNAELRAENNRLRDEVEECRIHKTELRVESVGLKRDLRRAVSFIREHGWEYPDPMDSSFSMEPPRIDHPEGEG